MNSDIPFMNMSVGFWLCLFIRKLYSQKDIFKNETAIKRNFAGLGNAATNLGEVISMCVVSVRLRHWNSHKEVSIFPLLDTCSQGTFVTDDLLKILELSGVRTSINIKILNGKKKVTSSLIEGLMISKQPLSKDKRIHWVKIPNYIQENIYLLIQLKLKHLRN